ncbi:MAG: hypothetical protein ACK42C_01135 [Aquificaceae bacterium]
MRKMALLLAGMSFSSFAYALEPIVYPERVNKTEFSLQLGLVDYKEKYLDKTWYARAGLDYRVKYPFLVGGGVYVSSSSDIWLLTPELRAKVRIPLFSTLKLDPYVGASLGYAENKVLDKKKALAGAVAGAELLYFAGGVHFGVSVGYSVYTDSRFNHLRAGFVVGF